MLRKGYHRALITLVLVIFVSVPVRPDGGYFSRTDSVESLAVSSDQRAIIIRNGDEISITFSTGYTGEGNEFAWIIPVPVVPETKDVFESGETAVRAFELLEQLTAPTVTTSGGGGSRSCFPAGTEVLTAEGPRAIETVQAGTEVRAYDLETGRWEWAKVSRTQSYPYDGDIVTVQVGKDVVRSTGNHPFFVQWGEGLEGRPWPGDVPATESGLTRGGRWAEARDLREGDVLLTAKHGSVSVTAVSANHEAVEVYNLTVDRLANYAVHRNGLLVHNKGTGEDAAVTDGASLVTVHALVTLEHYEVSILGAVDASALVGWLRANGYQVDPSATGTLGLYVEEGWAFVAVKLNPPEQRTYKNAFLPPLTVRYTNGSFVFPLRISSVSTVSSAKITLYVIAESTVASSNLQTSVLSYRSFIPYWADPSEYVEARIAETAQSGRIVVLWAGPMKQGELAGSFLSLISEPVADGTPLYLTRLEARMGPSEMNEDIHLALSPRYAFFSVSFEKSRGPFIQTPKQLSGLSAVTAVVPAELSTFALTQDGSVWAWGENRAGLLGDGTTTDRYAPVPLEGIPEVMVVVSAWRSTFALAEDGLVWAWGYNLYGQLGDGTTTDRPTPVRVAGIPEVMVVVSAWRSTFALARDGSVWAWGYNGSGQLGDGTTMNRHTSVRVAGLPAVTAVVPTAGSIFALTQDGSLWAWGYNGSGQLGDGTTMNRHTPVRVAGLPAVTAVVLTEGSIFALTQDGSLWAWGDNDHGRLGDGTTIDRPTPMRVARLPAVTAVVPTEGSIFALTQDGSVWAWGNNRHGALGDGTMWARSTPVQVEGLPAVTAVVPDKSSTFALTQDGSLWSWGDNDLGRLGDGTTIDRPRPMRVAGLPAVTAVVPTEGSIFALTQDGSLWSWGDNEHGQLGDGTTADRVTPARVARLPAILAVVPAWNIIFALTQDGSVWAWGNNDDGLLGTGEW
jgi:alpha-tubulin suppressor-like RCC1 family protein